MSAELDAFLADWTEDPNRAKPLFQSLYDFLKKQPDTELEYRGRAGVSHSLRAKRPAQKRPLFVLVDIIDDNSEARWLSVCFYADLVTDPEGLGDTVPGGLMGEDALCLDVESWDKNTQAYLLARLAEAHAAAGKKR